jgi:sulfatase maturation enzyme AslB (radical SAM superfamily)
MNVVLVYPTWKCGLDCPYCAYQQQPDNKSIRYLGANHLYKVERELTPEEWCDKLDSFMPAIYDFSGGEPLRYEGIVKVLNHLPKWSITSNTMNYTNDIDLSRCLWWTASFHPHIGEGGIDKFLKNIRRIRERGTQVAITLVAKPDTLGSVISWSNRLSALGFKVHIHPYYDDPNFKWKDYPKEMAQIKKSPFVVYGDSLFSFEGRKGNNFCRGGKVYFAIGPDGKVFRCLTSMLFGLEDKIGGQAFCDQECVFPCDWKYGGRT